MEKDRKRLEAKRITRWLVSAEPSAEMIDGKPVATSHDDSIKAGKYITNFKWCVREVARIKASGVNAYTKKVGGYCAVYSNLAFDEIDEMRNMEITEAEVEEMIAADKRKFNRE